VIAIRHHTTACLGIAGAGVVILIGAIAFSKRKSEGFGAEEQGNAKDEPSVPAPSAVEA